MYRKRETKEETETTIRQITKKVKNQERLSNNQNRRPQSKNQNLSQSITQRQLKQRSGLKMPN